MVANAPFLAMYPPLALSYLNVLKIPVNHQYNDDRKILEFLDENLIRLQSPVTYANSSDNNVISQIGSHTRMRFPGSP